MIQGEELCEMIMQVENADARSKHGESWKLINSITGCKNGKQGIIKGKGSKVGTYISTTY